MGLIYGMWLASVFLYLLLYYSLRKDTKDLPKRESKILFGEKISIAIKITLLLTIPFVNVIIPLIVLLNYEKSLKASLKDR